MAQFDVYKNPNPKTNQTIPYLLDIQNDILNNLSTRVVVPLVKTTHSITILNPIFTINSESVSMSTAELAGISCEHLETKICSLKEYREEIIGAVDFMITGF